MKKRYTEEDFITAFWQLYKTKPVEKISISQLCQLAGYNRSTFYNHFDDIYALLDRAVYNILSPAEKNVLSVESFYNLLQGDGIGSIFFTYFQAQEEYIELLFKRRHHYVLGEQIKKELLLYISKMIRSDADAYENIELLLEYHVSAVLGIINYWYQTGKVLSEQDLYQKIYDISINGVLNSLKAELENHYAPREG